LNNSDVVYLVFEILFVGLAFPLLGWSFGVHLADIEMNVFREDFCKGKDIFNWKGSIVEDIVITLLAIILWIALLISACFYDPPFPIVALLFAPFGALLRWILGKFLNVLNPDFPIGTFIANIAGSIGIGIAVVYMRKLSFLLNEDEATLNIRCRILIGIEEGFCGCLSTVSTFILELYTIRRKKWSYIYGITSVVVAQVCLYIIFAVADSVYFDQQTNSSQFVCA